VLEQTAILVVLVEVALVVKIKVAIESQPELFDMV
jgi:hypothetical protein